MKKHLALLATALAAGACATPYQLTLMPRDSGKLYYGEASASSGGEGSIAVTIEGRRYEGTWVEVVPDRASGYYSAGVGHRRGGVAFGGFFSLDSPLAGEVKALLRSADGAGLRCDLRGGAGFAGGGVCRDDRGLEYDVQVRNAPKP